MHEYDVVQKNELSIKLTFRKDGLPVDITNKVFKVILKNINDNLDNDDSAIVNKVINLTQDEIDNSYLFVILTSTELNLNVGKYKMEVIAKNGSSRETKLQAIINIIESVFKDE